MCSKYVWEGTMNKDFFISGLNSNKIYSFLLDFAEKSSEKQEHLKQIWEEPWNFYSIAINFRIDLDRFNKSIASEVESERKYSIVVGILLDVIFGFSLWACQTHTKTCSNISCFYKSVAKLLDEHWYHKRAIYNPKTKEYIVDESVSKNKCSFRLEKSGIKMHKPNKCYLIRANGMRDMIALFMNSFGIGDGLSFSGIESKLSIIGIQCIKRRDISYTESGSIIQVGL